MQMRVGLLGLLLVVVIEAGVGAQSSTADPVSGNEPSTAAPAIHWQTDTVDLRANDVTLQLGDKTFSPAGADVTVIEDIDTKGRWYLYATWSEDGHDSTVRLSFRSNGSDWHMETIAWWVSGLTMPEGGSAWGESGSGATNATRTAVGQTFGGDLEPRTRGYLVPCETAADGGHLAHNVATRLTFDGLRLTATPRERSLFDKTLRFFGLDGLIDPPRSVLVPQLYACGGARSETQGVGVGVVQRDGERQVTSTWPALNGWLADTFVAMHDLLRAIVKETDPSERLPLDDMSDGIDGGSVD